MKRIVCWIVGHDWIYGRLLRGDIEHRFCWRCSKDEPDEEFQS